MYIFTLFCTHALCLHKYMGVSNQPLEMPTPIYFVTKAASCVIIITAIM